jgi:hypothetical protein
MTPTALRGIAASAAIAGHHRDTAARGMTVIAAPAAARAATGDRKPDAVISADRVGSVPAARLMAVTLIAAAGSMIAVPADTGRIGRGATALAGTCPNALAAPSQMSGGIGAAAPLAIPGRSAATTGATVVRVTVAAGIAARTWLRVAVSGPRVVRGLRVAQGRARRSQGRQAGPAGQYGRGGRAARDARGGRAGRRGSVPGRAREETATIRTAAGATVAAMTVTGPRRPHPASRIVLPRIRFLAR